VANNPTPSSREMKIELTSSEERNRYLVRHPAEVQRILREVMQDKGIVTAYADDGRERMLTTIVDLDPRSVFLDCGADEGMNARLATCREVILSSTHDGVRVQFTSPPLERVRHREADALRAAMPAELLRLQRREYYRLVTSVVDPIKCRIPTDHGELEATVVDLSVGGIGIIAYKPDVHLEVGPVYHGCRIDLPALGPFAVSLTVRSTFEVTLRNGRRSHRAGCQFIDLPPGLQTALQRYITRAERDRRKRYL
jgi:c-di-GMP-binding flagellar brake protein YcgR